MLTIGRPKCEGKSVLAQEMLDEEKLDPTGNNAADCVETLHYEQTRPSHAHGCVSIVPLLLPSIV
jgi:hypothetical protein